jgi:hypothetical protein
MAKPKAPAIKGEHIVVTVVGGSLILLAQHLLADAEESWLRRLGIIR